jgi:ribosome-binding factor A
MQHRQERVAEIIRDVVAEIVLNDLADPNIGFVTVTRCRMTRDLKIATVSVSILGNEKQREESLQRIRHAGSYIRRQLARQVKLRYIPELRFVHDDVLAHERRVGELLEEIMPEESEDDTEQNDATDRGEAAEPA